mgnify:CR=1 FL=1
MEYTGCNNLIFNILCKLICSGTRSPKSHKRPLKRKRRKLISGKYYYFRNDGILQKGGITPDGYIVDENGNKIGESEGLDAQTLVKNSI